MKRSVLRYNEIGSRVQVRNEVVWVLTLISVGHHSIDPMQASVETLKLDRLGFPCLNEVAVRVSPFLNGNFGITFRIREDIEYARIG